MISIFGVVSAIVAILSIAALVLHFKLMQRRGALEDALANMKAALYPLESEDDENEEAPAATQEKVEEAAKAYNDAVKVYNEYISRFPGIIMAMVVGFEKEELVGK